MKQYKNIIAAYAIMILLIISVGVLQSWSIALTILNYCLISAVMTIGANIQWGYAGLINFGIMGYTALGGLAAVLVNTPPVKEAWKAGGMEMIISLILIILGVYLIQFILRKLVKSKKINAGVKNIEINIQELSSGIYYIKFKHENEISIQKFILNK